MPLLQLEVALGPKTELYLYQKGGKAIALTEDGTLEDENAGGAEEDFVGAAQGLAAGSTGKVAASSFCLVALCRCRCYPLRPAASSVRGLTVAAAHSC